MIRHYVLNRYILSSQSGISIRVLLLKLSFFAVQLRMMKRLLHDILYAIPPLVSFLSIPAVFMARSEEKNSLIPGLSPFRIGLIGAALALTVFSVVMFLSRRKNHSFLYYCSGLLVIISAEILLFSRFPSDNTRNLIPLIADRAKPLLWAMLVSGISWPLALSFSGKKPSRVYNLFLFITAVLVYWVISSHIDRYAWQIDLKGNTLICLSMALSAALWFSLCQSDIDRAVKTAAGCLFFAVLGYCVTRSTGMWMGRGETPPKAYWNELAEAMAHGRLYLEHPSGTHDLTFYNGRWYVPNPPLPGILLIPFVQSERGAAAVNMTVYSAVAAGINAGLLYLMLILAFAHEGGPLFSVAADGSTYPGNSAVIAAWVCVLFIFGTDHLWLGTTGQMWFISQLLVVTFTLLACICVICRFSPVFAGIALGFGMLCRPNIFPIWLCLLGLYLHQEREFPRLDWQKTFFWCLKSGLPVVFSVGLSLLYNKVRFDDWMDFGYVTINGADWILQAVQQYGMFHPHFLKTNAEVMLFGLPELDFSGERFFFQPHVAGYSIFLMTPALIYAFRAIRKSWFSIGAWASVIVSVALLLLYHNTGAEQIGYRYLLDITAPLALLMADGVGKKVSWLFKGLTIFSVILSLVGIYWWYLGRV